MDKSLTKEQKKIKIQLIKKDIPTSEKRVYKFIKNKGK